MTHEQLHLGSVERPLRPVMDFATIRNPLGASPETAYVKPEFESTESELSKDLSSLWKVSTDQIMLSNGSDAIIQLIPKVLINPEQKAVIPVPTYFGILENILHERMILSPLSPDDGFEYTDKIKEVLLRTIKNVHPGLVWLCSPNNPTGVVIPTTQIEQIAQATNPGIVIVDEAYQEIVDPENKTSAINLIDHNKNLIVTRTFSKAYGLQKIRVGMAIASPDIIRVLKTQRTENPNSHSLAIARIAVHDQEHIKKTHDLITRELRFFQDEVAGMENIHTGARSKSGVLIIRHTITKLHDQLLKLGIKTHDYNAQSGLENMQYVRLGLLNHECNLALIHALQVCSNYWYFSKTDGGVG